MTQQQIQVPPPSPGPAAPLGNGTHPDARPAQEQRSTTAPDPTVAPQAGAGSPAEEKPAASSQESPLRSSLSVLTTLGPPVTVASALMLYFGWARSDQQARAMGLDVSLFGYSTQDYILRSVNTLYLPLLVLGALALVWLFLHQRLVRALAGASSHPRLRRTGLLLLACGLLAAAGVVGWATFVPGQLPLLFPLLLAGGVAVGAYGGWLTRAAAEPAQGAAPLPWHRALRTLLVSAVIALALFWQLSLYAGVVGRGYADRLAEQIPQLPRATAFSPTPLGVEAPGVVEKALALGPSADKDTPRYRITGLRLLTRSGNRIFLLHDGWTPRTGTVIVLHDDDRIRWQFSH